MAQDANLWPLRLNFPSYYPCHFPLIDLQLQQRFGSSLLSLLPNAQMYSVPAFFIDLDKHDSALTWFHPNQFFQEKIDLFELTWTYAPTIQEGLAQLQDRLSHGEIVIVTGTSYELPYSADYHNQRYLEPLIGSGLRGPIQHISEFFIADHYVALTDMSAEGVTLYDPIPHEFIGSVSLDIFARFWLGNRQFDEFIGARGYERLIPYGMLDVLWNRQYQNQTINQLAQMVLSQVSATFLEGITKITARRRYFSGVALNAYIQEKFSTYYATSGEAPPTMTKGIFDMRWSRYFLRDLMHDLCNELSLPFQKQKEEVDALVKLWEQAHTQFFMMTRKGLAISEKKAQHFSDKLEEIATTERVFHENMLETLQNRT